MKRKILITIIVTLVLCLLAAPFALPRFENWHSKRAWEKYKRELEAQGEHLDADYFFPATVPDEQNFIKSPAYIRMCATAKSLQDGGLKLPEFTDIWNWEKGTALANFPMEEVLAKHPEIQPQIDELRAAAREYPRSLQPVPAYFAQDRSVWTFSWTNALAFVALHEAEYFQSQQYLAEFLVARIAEELKLHRNEEAFADLQIVFRVYESLRGLPFFAEFSQMVLQGMVMQPIWEGIASHGWTAPQLEKIEAWLRGIDFLANFPQMCRANRAWHNAVWEQVEADPRRLDTALSSFFDFFKDQPPSPAPTSIWSVQGAKQKIGTFYTTRTKPGMMYLNQWKENQFIQEKILPLVDPKSRRVNVRRTDEAIASLKDERIFGPRFDLARQTLSNALLAESLLFFAWSQNAVNLAAIACEIERYRLAHGALPATLEELHMPDLPHDLVTGGPLHYRVTGDDYLLYSTGWDGIDDNGRVGEVDATHGMGQMGDWAWSLKPLEVVKSP